MKEQSPTLVKNGKKYYLQFPFEQNVELIELLAIRNGKILGQ